MSLKIQKSLIEENGRSLKTVEFYAILKWKKLYQKSMRESSFYAISIGKILSTHAMMSALHIC